MRLFIVGVNYLTRTGHNATEDLYVVAGGYDEAEQKALRWLEVQEGYGPESNPDDKPVPEQIVQIEAAASLFSETFTEGTLLIDAVSAVH